MCLGTLLQRNSGQHVDVRIIRSLPLRCSCLASMLLSEPLPFTTQAAMSEAAAPPVAPRKPRVMTKFGDRRVDPYSWLRDKADPAVKEYLIAENRYTDAVMKPLEGFREALYKEILGRIKETDESVPHRRHGYWYYQREVQGRSEEHT